MKYYDFACKKCGAHVDWAYQGDLCPDCWYEKRQQEQAVIDQRQADADNAKAAEAEKCNHPCPICGLDTLSLEWVNTKWMAVCKNPVCHLVGEGSLSTWGAQLREDVK